MRRSLNCNVELNEKLDGTGELTFTTHEKIGFYQSKRHVTVIELDQKTTKTLSVKFTMLNAGPYGQ